MSAMTDTKHAPTPYRMGSYSGVDPNNPGKTISTASVWLAGERVAFFEGDEASAMALGFEQGANSAHRRVATENAELWKAFAAAERIIEKAIPKFNWAKSALDAEAIAALNEGMLQIDRTRAALAKAEGGAA